MKQNHSSFIFSKNLITFFHFSPSGKRSSYLPLNVFENTRVSCHKCGVKKIKLSRLLAQRINEFKMNELQRKTPQ